MSQESEFETDLREMLGRGQVVAVLGSGVSVATTSRAPSWRGLIDSGVERCRSIGVPDDWCQYVRGQLQLASHPDMLLSAAELVHQKLREQGGELARWLRETFAELQPEDPTVIQLLVKLNVPLVTTNYSPAIGLDHLGSTMRIIRFLYLQAPKCWPHRGGNRRRGSCVKAVAFTSRAV